MGLIIDHLYSQFGIIDPYYGGLPSSINYGNNNVFSLFFKVKTCGNRIELPIFGREVVQAKILTSLQTGHRGDIVIPFIIDGNRFPPFRSIDTLLKHFTLIRPNINAMYRSAKTNKGEVYYGTEGLIFDKDMNPLFMSSIECDIEGTTIIYRKVKAYIHPSVFYSEGTVEKCLINKIIPYSLKKGIVISNRYRVSNVKNSVNYSDPDHCEGYYRAVPEIVVTDVKDKFFCKPVPPSSTFRDKELNEFLKDNLNDVLSIMKI